MAGWFASANELGRYRLLNDTQRPDEGIEGRHPSVVDSPLLGTDDQLKCCLQQIEEPTDFVRHEPQIVSNIGESRTHLRSMEAEVFMIRSFLHQAKRDPMSVGTDPESFTCSLSACLRAPLRHVCTSARYRDRMQPATYPCSGRHARRSWAHGAVNCRATFYSRQRPA